MIKILQNLAFLPPIPSRFNHSIKDWRCRQVWLFVLCQEHSTDINYQCRLHNLALFRVKTPVLGLKYLKIITSVRDGSIRGFYIPAKRIVSSSLRSGTDAMVFKNGGL
jgi:hypothetical protein